MNGTILESVAGTRDPSAPGRKNVQELPSSPLPRWQQISNNGRVPKNMSAFELMIQQLKRQREDIEKQMHDDDERQQETSKIFERIRQLKERVERSLIPGAPPKD